MKEKIICACYIMENWKPSFWMRHGSALFVAKNVFMDKGDLSDDRFWFWTNTWRFLNRKEAFVLVFNNWQLRRIDEDGKIINFPKGYELNSEDLW